MIAWCPKILTSSLSFADHLKQYLEVEASKIKLTINTLLYINIVTKHVLEGHLSREFFVSYQVLHLNFRVFSNLAFQRHLIRFLENHNSVYKAGIKVILSRDKAVS